MPKRPSRPKPDDDDVNLTAFRVFREATGETTPTPAPEVAPELPREKNAAAVALGRLGGKKGGVNRMASMTPEQRSELAKAAAAKRWKKPDSAP